MALRGIDGSRRRPRAFIAHARRRKRVRLLLPQFDAQLPGPGVIHSHPPESSVFPPPRLPHGELGSRGGGKTRLAPDRIVAASTREESAFVEDRLRAQQMIDGAAELGGEDAERLARRVFFMHA